MTAFVEILLSTHNGETYLEQQIKSIIEQSYQDWRIIARDDGSHDATVSILSKYSRLLGDRFMLLDDAEGNLGIVRSYSQLISYSKAPYIMFCDQDDVWLSGKITDTLDSMNEAETNWSTNIPILVHTDLTVTDGSLTLIAGSFWKYQHIDPRFDSINRLLVQNTVTGCSMMVNRATLDYINGIPENAIMHDWWIALICSVFGKIVSINKPTLSYRQHEMNDTGAKNWNFNYIIKKINRHAIQKSIIAMQKQADAFLESYEDLIDIEKKTIIKTFLQTGRDNWLKKRVNLLRYQIIMQGLFRNIGLFTFI